MKIEFQLKMIMMNGRGIHITNSRWAEFQMRFSGRSRPLRIGGFLFLMMMMMIEMMMAMMMILMMMIIMMLITGMTRAQPRRSVLYRSRGRWYWSYFLSYIVLYHFMISTLYDIISYFSCHVKILCVNIVLGGTPIFHGLNILLN